MAYVENVAYEKGQEDPLWAIAAGLFAVATQLKNLGNGDSASPTTHQVGAIEGLAMLMRDDGVRVNLVWEGLAEDSIAGALDRIADILEKKSEG